MTVTFTIPGESSRAPRACACGAHGFVGLTRGFVAFFDAGDVPRVAGYTWSILKNRDVLFAVSHEKSGNRAKVYLHRKIIGPSDGEIVYHQNGNGLNNFRSNLRVCDNRQNIQNRRSRKGCRYRGVSKVKALYQARIVYNGARKSLGYFRSEEEAAREYDRAAMKYFGKYARLNFGGSA